MSAMKIALFTSLLGIVTLSWSETISTNPAANTDRENQHTVSSHQYGARAPVVKPQPQNQPPVIVVVPANANNPSNNQPQLRRENRR
jgi:hypothetical protein